MQEIVRITTENLPFLKSLEEKLFSDPWSMAALESWLEQKGARGYLLTEDKSPLAYALFQSTLDEGELLRCGVLPEQKRKGYGFSLISQAITEEKKSEIRRIFLEVRSENLPAKNLYEKLGFALVGKRKNYYQKPTDDALIYEIHL